MHFNPHVRLFNLGTTSLLGDVNTGNLVGLTPNGCAVCKLIIQKKLTNYKEATKFDPTLIKHLKAAGFFSQPKNVSKPKVVAYVHVTQRCNLSCKGCYSYDVRRNSYPDINLEKTKQILSALFELGAEEIIVSGGEPLLRKDIDAILKYAKKTSAKCKITLLTNGTLVNKEVALKLQGLVDKISISFDGFSNTSHAYIRKQQRFFKLINSVKTIQNVGIYTEIVPTIHAQNYGDLDHYAKLARHINSGLHYSLFTFLGNTSQGAHLVPSQKQQALLAHGIFTHITNDSTHKDPFAIASCLRAQENCGAGHKVISVDYQGNLFPCHMLHHSKLSMGNLATSNSKTLQDIKSQLKAYAIFSVNNFEKCACCNFKYLCGGGCRARAYYASNNLYAHDPYCTINKTFYSLCSNRLNLKSEEEGV